MTTTLRSRIRELPKRPGVYLFKDTRGNVLYVGKARSLKTRVSSYLAPKHLDPAKRELVGRARSVGTIVTKSDAEALALEATLIQKHAPPYNVRLVDDSSYLYVRISKDTFPTVSLTRRVEPDGAWYRGPYPVASAIRTTLREARKLFPWCAYPNPGAAHDRSCFAYHIGLCPGVCVGRVSVEEYQRTIEDLKRFLDGETRGVLRLLRARMAAASEREEYERAASLRDAMRSIEKATVPIAAATPRRESADAIGVARRGTHAVVSVLSICQGCVVGSRAFPLMIGSDESTPALLRGFLLGYLPRAASETKTILLPERVEDAHLLTGLAGHILRLSTPRRGWKRRLLDLAKENAEAALAEAAAELTSPPALATALRALAGALHLKGPLRRIEAYDISNIQGVLATGSLVVFLDGKPARREYRRFKIQTVVGSDDVGMMREVLRRRFGRHLPRTEKRGERRTGDERHWPMPDLVLLDGGKGQLNAGTAVFQELRVNVPIAALAKPHFAPTGATRGRREEELFVPGRKDPLRLPHTSPALFLLQRIRDEAHRFTLGYHQLLRKRRMTTSLLENIPGVGNMTRKKLLRAFGSLRGIEGATERQLTNVVGPKLAATLQRALMRIERVH